MKKNITKTDYSWLIGMIFIAPIVFSTRLLEMDNLQKTVFFLIVIPAFIYLLNYKNEQEGIKVHKSLFILFLIFPLTFLTSIANGSEDMLILQLTYLIPPLFIIIFTVFAINKIGEDLFFKICSISIVFTATIFSSIGLLQVMNVELIPLPQIIIPGSTIGHRGFAAEYLLPAIPFLFILKNFVKKDYFPLLFFAGVINLSFLFFTRSRSALGISILILIAIIIYILFNQNYKSKVKSLAPFLAVFIIAFLLSLIPPIKGERSDFSANVTSVVDADNRSNKMRMHFWNASFEMIKENPLTGVGLQRWSGVYQKYYGDEFVDNKIHIVHAIHSHNDFLELFAENGFVSPIIYSLILLLIIFNLYKKSILNDNYLYVLLSVLSIICFSFIAFPIVKFSSYFFLAFAAGLALISFEKQDSTIQISNLKIKYLLIVLIVMGIVTSYIRLNSELSYVKSIEFKNGGDYNNMFKELDKINPVLYPFDPSKQPVEFYKATALYRLGKLDDALIHSINSEKIAPNNPLVLHNTAAIYQSSKKYNKAIVYYEQLRKLFPNYIDPQINLLLIYTETGAIEKGKELFDELKTKDPQNSRLISFKSRYSDQF